MRSFFDRKGDTKHYEPDINNPKFSTRDATKDCPPKRLKSAWALASPRFSHGSAFHINTDNISMTTSSHMCTTSITTPNMRIRQRPHSTSCSSRDAMRSRKTSTTKERRRRRRQRQRQKQKQIRQGQILPKRRKWDDRDDEDEDNNIREGGGGSLEPNSHTFNIPPRRSTATMSMAHNIDREPSPLLIDDEFDFLAKSSLSLSLSLSSSPSTASNLHHRSPPHSSPRFSPSSSCKRIDFEDMVVNIDDSMGPQLGTVGMEKGWGMDMKYYCRSKRHQDEGDSRNKFIFPGEEEDEEECDFITSDITANASSSTGSLTVSPPPPPPPSWDLFKLTNISIEEGDDGTRGSNNNDLHRLELASTIIPQQHQLELSVFRLTNKLDDLAIKLKSKDCRIDELIKLSQDQEKEMERQRRLRVHVELGASSACEGAISETRRFPMEQENKANLYPSIGSCSNRGIVVLENSNHITTTIKNSSGDETFEVTDCPIMCGDESNQNDDDGYKDSCHPILTNKEIAIRQLFEIQQKEIAKLKAYKKNIIQNSELQQKGQKLKLDNESSDNNPQLSTTTSSSLSQIRQELDSIRSDYKEMQISTKEAFESSTRSIVQNCERLKAYVEEELSDTNSKNAATSAHRDNSLLRIELHKAKQEIQRLRHMEITEETQYFESSSASSPKGRRTMTSTTVCHPSPVPTMESWCEFTTRFRHAISGPSVDLQFNDSPTNSIVKRLDSPGTKMAEKLFQELCFTTNSSCSSPKSSLMTMPCNIVEEEGSSDRYSGEDMFQDAANFLEF